MPLHAHLNQFESKDCCCKLNKTNQSVYLGKRTISEFSAHTLIKNLIVKTPYTSTKTKMKTLIGQ